ncbi:MAG: DUF6431 domain-containing protein [Firmicutes bacterium]|nr:DUF6431 domain-containing protein [Bacillota bacterium]
MDGPRHLAAHGGRRCPCCGRDTLIGNGHRRRTYQWQAVRRGRPRSLVAVYRVVCTACRHSHTVLPPQLGPHKRYALTTIEQALVALSAGTPKARVSAMLSGVSTERISTWLDHLRETIHRVRLAAEAIVTTDPLFRLPAAVPQADVLTYLTTLLGRPQGLGLLVALNLLLSYNLPLATNLLLHPPTSHRRSGRPCPSAPVGGMPFG